MIGVLEKQSSFPPSMHGTRRASVRRHYRGPRPGRVFADHSHHGSRLDRFRIGAHPVT